MKDESNLFLRYIDDIFMVWTKSEYWTETSLYQKHLSIKFDYKFYCKWIDFSENQMTVKIFFMWNSNTPTL